jgi:predicted porin
MKKTALIATAVAMAISGSAMAASHAAGATVYGIFHNALTSNDAADMWTVDTNASRLGVKGSEDLGNGMKAVYQVELAMTTDGGGVFGTNTRNTFVGVAGDFGTVAVGRHDTPSKMAFYAAGNDHLGDSAADLNGSFGFTERRVDNAIAYISNDMNGLKFAVAVVPGETATDNGIADSTSVGVMYSAGDIKFGAGMDSLSNDDTTLDVGGSYTMGDLVVGAQFQSNEVGAADTTFVALSAKYKMGANDLIGSFGTSDIDSSDGTVMNLAVRHNMSKRTNVYAAFSSREEGTAKAVAADDTKISLGLFHKF